jgi:hypothetical protein
MSSQEPLLFGCASPKVGGFKIAVGGEVNTVGGAEGCCCKAGRVVPGASRYAAHSTIGNGQKFRAQNSQFGQCMTSKQEEKSHDGRIHATNAIVGEPDGKVRCIRPRITTKTTKWTQRLGDIDKVPLSWTRGKYDKNHMPGHQRRDHSSFWTRTSEMVRSGPRFQRPPASFSCHCRPNQTQCRVSFSRKPGSIWTAMLKQCRQLNNKACLISGRSSLTGLECLDCLDNCSCVSIDSVLDPDKTQESGERHRIEYKSNA